MLDGTFLIHGFSSQAEQDFRIVILAIQLLYMVMLVEKKGEEKNRK